MTAGVAAGSQGGRRPAVVFDIGGVLLDWNPRHLYRRMFADEAAVEAFLVEVGFDAWNIEQDRGRRFADAVLEAVGRFPHHRAPLEAYDSRWTEMLGGTIDGTVAIHRALRRAGYPLHAITNFNAEKFRIAAALHPVLADFDSVLVSGEVGLIKPDPAIFRMFLANTQMKAFECIYIDDNAHNVDAASGLGFQALRFTSPEELARDLGRLGVELPGL